MVQVPLKILIIAGPTAAGKSRLALSLLSRIPGEIISADSRQIYKHLDYVTNKISPGDQLTDIVKNDAYWLVNGQKINLYDVITINKTYSVSDFVHQATGIVQRVHTKCQLPIVTGGTGYYIDALLGFSKYSGVVPNLEMRACLNKKSLSKLNSILEEKDPVTYQALASEEKQNKRRLIRICEIVETVGSRVEGLVTSFWEEQIKQGNVKIKYIVLISNKQNLYSRIDKWVDSLVEIPEFFQELKTIINSEDVILNLKQGLIIKEGLAHLHGEFDYETMINTIKGRLHRYIRHQIIWFKRNTTVEWVEIDHIDWQTKLLGNIEKWYYQTS